MKYLSDKEIERLKFFIWFFITVVAISAVSFGVQKYIESIGPQTYPGFASVQTTEMKPVDLKIEDIHFRIPRNYIDSFDKESVLLVVLLPDLEPKTEQNRDYFTRNVGDQNPRLNILIMTDKNFLGLDKDFERKSDLGVDKQGQKYDLEFWSIKENKKVAQQWEHEIYTYFKNGKTNLLITCNNKEDAIINSRCKQIFIHRGLQISLSYRKHYLPQWKELQDKSTALIDSFIISKFQGENFRVQSDSTFERRFPSARE